MSPDLSDMKKPPNLKQGEELITCVSSKVGDVIRSNAIVAVTNERIITEAKRGRSVPDEESGSVGFEIPIESIETLRKHGVVNMVLEIVTSEEVYELPPIERAKVSPVVEAIVNQGELEKTTYGDETTSASITKKVLSLSAMAIGVIFLITGVVSWIAGILAIISIAGILFGILLLFSGSGFGAIGYLLVKWSGVFGFGQKEEWVRNSVE